MQTSTMIAIAVAIFAGLGILYYISYLKDKKDEKKLPKDKPKEEGQTNEVSITELQMKTAAIYGAMAKQHNLLPFMLIQITIIYCGYSILIPIIVTVM